MEETLVNDIKRLRVLTPSDHDNMDEQVPDHSIPVSESQCITKICKISQTPKKDDRSAHSSVTNSTGRSALKSSDESESSLDDGVRYRMIGCASHSDSDDLENLWHQQKVNSWRPSAAPTVESDSVNENFHPARHPKRKRKFKRMAVDPHPSIENEDQSSKWISAKCDSKRNHSIRTKSLPKVTVDNDSVENIWKKFLENPESFCGKRKRSIREKNAGCSVADKRPNFSPNRIKGNSDASTKWSPHNYLMECDGIVHNTQWEPSSSGLSSSESECGILTNDEGREADDEQSDCFHESATSSGILVEELLPKNVNAFRRRLEYVTNYTPRVSQLKHSLLDSWKPIVCHSLKEETLRNEIMQGEFLKSGSKKRRRAPSVTPPFHAMVAHSSSISESHGSPSTWNMDWKPETGSASWLNDSRKHTSRPSLPAKKRGFSVSEVPQNSTQACASQIPQLPYFVPHSFVPAHNPGDLSLPFTHTTDEAAKIHSDYNVAN